MPAASRVAVVSVVALGYYLCAVVGYAFVVPGNVAVVWPASGFMLALLLIAPPREWPFLMLGALAGNIAADLLYGIPWPLALAGAAANGAEVLAVTAMLLWFVGRPFTLNTLQRASTFIVGVAALTALTSLVGALVIVAAADSARFWTAWAYWWIGDSLGMLIVTPAILTLRTAITATPKQWRLVGESVALLATLTWLASFIQHNDRLPGVMLTADPYMLLPVVLWTGIRLGLTGAATATLLVAAVTVSHAAEGTGPFVGSRTSLDVVVQIYGYLTIVTLSSLLAAAAVHERRGLEESRGRLADILDAAPDFVTIGQWDGPPLYMNRAAREALGIGATEQLSTLLEVRPAAFEQVLRGTILPALSRDGVWRGDTEYVSRTGRVIPVSQVTVAHKDATGRISFISTISRDISERLRADAQIRLLARAIESTTEMVTVTDPDGRLTFVNPAFLRTYGYTADEILGHTPDVLRPSDISPDVLADLRTRSRRDGWRGEIRNRRKDGSEILISLNTSPIRDANGELVGLLGVARDITEQRLLEEQLRQAQKMEAVGQLAGGVAHDFNNILTAILGYAELLSWDHLLSKDQRDSIAAIRESATRAAGLTKQLLAFGRRQVLQPRVLRMSHVVEDVAPMLRRLVGEHISIRTDGDDDPTIRADVTQMEQILLNLAVNAADAMPDSGHLTISVGGVTIDDAYAAKHPDVARGRYAWLAVSDTGVGMDAATRARIFEPFFTTKPIGRGTGLGLATVYGIVKQMRGSVVVESEPGRGSTFRIFLPVCAEDSSAAGVSDRLSEGGTVVRGAGTVLLVEDEAGVRAFATRVLERHGYRVIAAANPAQALQHLECDTATIDLVLTDMRMPGGTGTDLAASVRSRHPRARVLYMSGYSELADTVPARDFIAKPFGVEELVARVRSALDAAPAA